jgi:prophage antirepressor-like protein
VSDLIPFDYNGSPLRCVQINGEAWFVASDVCALLGIGRVNDATTGLDEDEKGTATIRTPGGDQQMATVNEPGLYSLILRSRKAAAKVFKRWVTHEVLPAIRKTGGYLANPDQLDELEVAERYVAAIRDKRELQAQLAIAGPKAEYVDSFVNNDDLTLLRVLANQLQVGEKALREHLILHRVIYRKVQGSRYSASRGRMVREFSYHAGADYKTWFVERDQPEAPRYHNGQMRTTLYATPIGKVRVGDLLRRHPINAA